MDDLISRRTAIDLLKDWSGGYDYIETETKAAIMTFQQLPSAQPEYHFDEWCTDCKEYDHERHCCPRFNAVIKTTIEEMEADRKNSVWIEEPNCWYRCSRCGNHYPSIRGHMDYNYCPNCGADMRGENNETD